MVFYQNRGLLRCLEQIIKVSSLDRVHQRMAALFGGGRVYEGARGGGSRRVSLMGSSLGGRVIASSWAVCARVPLNARRVGASS